MSWSMEISTILESWS